MKTFNQALGEKGETLACNYYSNLGFEILERNVRISRVGEIDFIAVKEIDGVTTFAFVEVKTRSSSKFGDGIEAITFNKRIRMRSCALHWLKANGFFAGQYCNWQLDVVVIDFENSIPKFSFYKNIEVA